MTQEENNELLLRISQDFRELAVLYGEALKRCRSETERIRCAMGIRNIMSGMHSLLVGAFAGDEESWKKAADVVSVANAELFKVDRVLGGSLRMLVRGIGPSAK